MTSRKRITFALVGLIVLVVVGWFVGEFNAGGTEPYPNDSAPSTASVREHAIAPVAVDAGSNRLVIAVSGSV